MDIHNNGPTATLNAAGGPLDGQTIPLRSELVLGRRDKPGQLGVGGKTTSRRHALIQVNGQGVQLTDLGSTNGTKVNGSSIAGTVALTSGDQIAIGQTSFVLSLSEDPALHRDLDHQRRPHVDQAAKGPGPVPIRTLTLDQPPETVEAKPTPVLAVTLPLLVGLLGGLTIDPRLLIIVLASPVVLGVSIFEAYRSGRMRFLQEQERFRAKIEPMAKRVRAMQKPIVAWRQAQFPDGDRLLRMSRSGDSQIWSRRPDHPDFLMVAPCDADQATLLMIKHPDVGDAELRAEMAAALSWCVVDPSVPVRFDLAQHRVVGICGPEASADVARSIVAQLVTLNSPQHLRLAVFAPHHRSRWDWTDRLPHAERSTSHNASGDPQAEIEELDGLIKRQLATSSSCVEQATPSAPHLVVVVQAPFDASDAMLDDWAEVANRSRMTIIHVAEYESELPTMLDAVIVVDVSGGCRISVNDARHERFGSARRLPSVEAVSLTRNLRRLAIDQGMTGLAGCSSSAPKPVPSAVGLPTSRPVRFSSEPELGDDEWLRAS